ncbi:2Fe-2S iron-sulfur cluster-binding protein [Puniceibacterium sp. IMCC21224]|uniref:2Fe-2S iron-sulfur cluster-binding protein n=1 Tax=Puniceibacterium sp. IMCC21224 TaxID=1618204 RepID=UPI00064DC10D|nr:2Fe-2S iron-sulfur cluster-binding protein [Puniceibacterium sp. IMCC21224]KMK69079.1 ferredoxin [Puniceibacterium sp. IMCC21224]
MTKLTFVLPAGEREEHLTETPTSAMNVARLKGVRGIEAECGGALSCGTCHVYVDEADMDKLPPASEEEMEMLSLVASELKETSRLSCQIELSDNIDSLILHIPATQY